jgi:hypothetical protein
MISPPAVHACRVHACRECLDANTVRSRTRALTQTPPDLASLWFGFSWLPPALTRGVHESGKVLYARCNRLAPPSLQCNRLAPHLLTCYRPRSIGMMEPLLTLEQRKNPAWLSWLAHVELSNFCLQHEFRRSDVERAKVLVSKYRTAYSKVPEYAGWTKPKHHFLDHLWLYLL